MFDKRLSNKQESVVERVERVRKVVEEERRVLVEKARLLAEGIVVESYTAYLGLRVRPTIKQLWEAAPRQAKRAAKQALEAAILAYYLGGQASLSTHLYGAPPVINMNLNIVEARAEAKAEAKVDLEPLVKLLEELLRELQIIRNLARYPSQTNAAAISRKAETLIEKIKKMREQMVFN